MEPLFFWPFPVLFPEHQNKLQIPIRAGCWRCTNATEWHPASGQECFPSPAVCQLAERATGSARSGTFHGVVQKQGFLNVIKSRVTQDTACCSVATFSICCGKLGLGNGLSPICTMVTTQLINAVSLEEFLNPS